MVETNAEEADLAPADFTARAPSEGGSRRPTFASLSLQLASLTAEHEHLRRAIAEAHSEIAATRREVAELRALLLHLAGVESVSTEPATPEAEGTIEQQVTPPPASLQTSPSAAYDHRPAGQAVQSRSSASARDPRYWRGQWDSLRQQLAHQVAQAGSAELQRVQETVESYYQELVVDWELCRAADADSPPWNEWQLSRLDFHLYQSPSLLDDEPVSGGLQSLLCDLEAVIGDAQAARRRELRDDLGLERIEGEVGADCWRAYVLERDPNCLPEATQNEAWEGTFCRILPGRGGYRWQGQVLRPSYAIYYRYDG